MKDIKGNDLVSIKGMEKEATNCRDWVIDYKGKEYPSDKRMAATEIINELAKIHNLNLGDLNIDLKVSNGYIDPLGKYYGQLLGSEHGISTESIFKAIKTVLPEICNASNTNENDYVFRAYESR